MTLPIQSVKHVRATYQKYLNLTIICAALTVLAAFLAALSSFQLSNLNKAQKAAVNVTTSAADKAVAALNQDVERLKTKLTEAQDQLKQEKTNAKELRAKIAGLEKQLAAIAEAARSKPPVLVDDSTNEAVKSPPAPASTEKQTSVQPAAAPIQPTVAPKPVQKTEPAKPKTEPQSSAPEGTKPQQNSAKMVEQVSLKPKTDVRPQKAASLAAPKALSSNVPPKAKPQPTESGQASASPTPLATPSSDSNTTKAQPISEQKLPDQPNLPSPAENAQ